MSRARGQWFDTLDADRDDRGANDRVISALTDDYDELLAFLRELQAAIYDLEKRMIVVEQWREYSREHGQSIPTWTAILVTGGIGIASLVWQIIAGGRP